MGKDARLELRVELELKRRVDARARELGQKTTTFVERALEAALGSVGAMATAEPDRGSSAPPRASGPDRPPAHRESFPKVVSSPRDAAMSRQAALNRARESR